MAKTPPAAPRTSETELSGNVLFYNQPEPLNAEHHAKLGLVNVEKPFGFARSGHVIPLTVGEFAQAAVSFPIIFAGPERIPLAVMGLNAGDNLFIDDTGAFADATYLPAYIRRYPFVLAGNETDEQMIVCIDRGSKLLSEKGETKLFDADGQPSEYTKNAIKFCDDFEVERRRSMAFVQLLKDLDLLEPKQAVYTPQNEDGSLGQPQLIADYFAVTEEKVKALTPKKLAELRDNGALGAIYAHMVSLTGWDRLMAVAAAKGPSALPRVAPAANA
jgi:hypothetical protein